MDNVKIQEDPLSIEKVTELISDPSAGGLSLFVGVTRDNFNGKKVVQLEYEAYSPMALKEMNKICQEIRAKWPSIKHIALYHRIGQVPITEASVIIAASSPHRVDCQAATQFGIDALKATVPIWKKEFYEDSSSRWKENAECCWSKNKSQLS
ncbi:molybdopterin synthase catalytic subunit-like [Tubulanus polymorphus]|uniref:molybdopterin synthase catalytic subunit-like n=1 Tax=Tubulanus polymorphus TaxID=672921 RepID=UPI003DA265DC